MRIDNQIATHDEAGPYRADIDGLRAIAVSAVVAYHALPHWAPGGFVGVDVFFVISGFLITRILAGQADGGRIGFLRFYGRRARRILPAYFAMVAITAVAAAVALTPKALQAFGAVLAASGLFLTNAWFANTVVYFQPASRDAPLLHLWSLALEEQFYLVWPLLIGLLSLKRLRPLRPILMLTLAGLSLVVAERLIGRGASRDAFYYLPGRTWEFLAGGLLSVGAIPRPPTRWIAELTAAAGLVLILVGIVWFSDATPFPGLAALLPCLGAALVIWSGEGIRTAVAAALRTPPVVGLGRVSYSFYLWHWPPLVLARLVLQRPLSMLETVGLVALALVLAILSWRFVEQPWRVRRGRIVHAGLAVAAALALVGAGAFLFTSHGLPGRMPAGVVLEDTDISPMRDRCFLGWTPDTTPPAACVQGDPTAAGEVLVWGDSHADAVTPGVLAWAQPQGLKVRQATRAGCPPLIGARPLVDGRLRDPGCSVFDRKTLDLIADPAVRLVVISARWPLYMDAQPLTGGYDPPMTLADPASGAPIALGPALVRTLDAIAATGSTAQVVVIGPVPELPLSPPDCLVQRARFHLDPAACHEVPATIALARAAPATDAIARAVAGRPNVRAVYPSRSLCTATACQATADGRALYFDADHLSASGARRLVPVWMEGAAAQP